MKDLFNKLLIEALQEGKQVGKLYHFTDYGGMRKIMESDFRMKGGYETLSKLVSFTRNRNFKSLSVPTDQVRITLDGNAMSDKYKITPHADTEHNYGRYSKKKFDNSDESEERIDTSRYGGYIEIEPYLELIEVIPYEKGQPHIKRQYGMLIEAMKIYDDKSERFIRLVDKFS